MTVPTPLRTAWSGLILGVQARIDLERSFDQRFHSYLGFLLVVDGEADGERRSFSVRIGPGAQSKHGFRAGDRVSGVAHRVADAEAEVADFYRASALKLLSRPQGGAPLPPPWQGEPQELGVYRERGHRRLASQTYEGACATCQWGCRMAVKLVIDQWNPGVFRRRFETFCYGPKSCSLYRPGPRRQVPGRRGMSYTEEDWVDEEATSGRGPDE
jgi:hypothetical protein